MDGLERKMPSTIDYSDVLPMSVPAVSRRRKFYPVNGGEFRAGANSEIRIPIDSTSALLDAAHSYLEFTVRNFDPAATLSLDAGGAAMFFSRVRVEQQGRKFYRIHRNTIAWSQVLLILVLKLLEVVLLVLFVIQHRQVRLMLLRMMFHTALLLIEAIERLLPLMVTALK
jgi:hypothetical protein